MATQSETLKQSAVEHQLPRLRSIAIVPAHNEEASLGALLAEIRIAEPDLAVVVINDGSTDSTARVAEASGVPVVNLPFNVGIGGTVQTGYQYALEHGYEIAIQVDADGQHDPTEIGRVLEPILEDRADLVVGTRFVTGGGYRGTRVRRMGIHIFASVVSLMVGQRVSDTTSGFRAVNRKALRLFAKEYPHDYPEVESIVLLSRHGLRMLEVPVRMRVRETGASSITALRAAYYMIKVLLALFIGLFRRYPTPQEEQ
jgi:glycosyltransferase involved in cell wall biosynthesis